MREPSNNIANIANDPPVKCVWMLAGVVDYKLCDREYDCDRCRFDQAFRDNAHAARPTPTAGDGHPASENVKRSA